MPMYMFVSCSHTSYFKPDVHSITIPCLYIPRGDVWAAAVGVRRDKLFLEDCAMSLKPYLALTLNVLCPNTFTPEYHNVTLKQLIGFGLLEGQRVPAVYEYVGEMVYSVLLYKQNEIVIIIERQNLIWKNHGPINLQSTFPHRSLWHHNINDFRFHFLCGSGNSAYLQEAKGEGFPDHYIGIYSAHEFDIWTQGRTVNGGSGGGIRVAPANTSEYERLCGMVPRELNEMFLQQRAGAFNAQVVSDYETASLDRFSVKYNAHYNSLSGHAQTQHLRVVLDLLILGSNVALDPAFLDLGLFRRDERAAVGGMKRSFLPITPT